MAKRIKYLVIHATATPEGREVTKQDIERWHLSPKPQGRGWSRVGYSMLIQMDGTIVHLHPFDNDDFIDAYEITNGAKGINSVSRHIVYSGGLDKNMRPKDTRTYEQKNAMYQIVHNYVKRYPWIKAIGHNEIANKACPCFDVPKWLREKGIDDKHIL